ncbi:MAG: PrsW family intramembrane metalloprotease [Bacteroidales bacterium]|nr:PrsW family intramembrane metalloprotease [Bacteroidales bacterium]
MNLTLTILAILPVYLILRYVYRKDNNKEPLSKLLYTFIAGCICIVPAAMQESLLSFFAPVTPISNGLYNGFVVAGFSEELWKLILLSLIIWRSREFDEYFDGIVYAVFLSMGFACVENLMYIFQPDDLSTSYSTAIVRAMVSVPGHFLFAVAMGYYFSLAKFDPAHRSTHLLKALLYPTLLHGTFDAILMISENLGGYPLVGSIMFFVFIYFDVKLWKKGLTRIRHMEQLSHQQDFDRQNPFANFKWTF